MQSSLSRPAGDRPDLSRSGRTTSRAAGPQTDAAKKKTKKGRQGSGVWPRGRCQCRSRSKIAQIIRRALNWAHLSPYVPASTEGLVRPLYVTSPRRDSCPTLATFEREQRTARAQAQSQSQCQIGRQRGPADVLSRHPPTVCPLRRVWLVRRCTVSCASPRSKPELRCDALHYTLLRLHRVRESGRSTCATFLTNVAS